MNPTILQASVPRVILGRRYRRMAVLEENCSVEGCARLATKRGLCGMHYQRVWKRGTPDDARPTISACSVAECDRRPRSRTSGLCEVHYYRLRRTGSTADPLRKSRRVDARGYVQVYAPGHTLSDKTGWAYEHRLVLYQKIADAPAKCYICGCVVSWDGRDNSKLSVDHLNGVKGDNRPVNLQPSCNPCNVERDCYRVGRGDKPCVECGAKSDRDYCSRRCAGRAGSRKISKEHLDRARRIRWDRYHKLHA